MALTDYDWFCYLRERLKTAGVDQEVNFWKPSAQTEFRAVPPLSPFFFKLKSPHYKIAGFGYFVRHSTLPVWLAWDSFREANGAPGLSDLCQLIRRYTNDHTIREDRLIGCSLIAESLFFEESEWIDAPADWHPSIQKGKTYDLESDGEGRRIWNECLLRARGRRIGVAAAADQPRYAEETFYRPRLGQGLFRIMVTEAYQRACAVTSEHSLPVLEAAHIKPYSEGGEHDPRNGLLLRSDIHRLFDRGYVTVSPEYKFEVSRRLKDDFDNGRSYYGFQGKPILLPADIQEQPSPELLAWHNQKIYLG